MKELTIRRDAELDLDETYRWYESHRDGLGEEFLSKVSESLHEKRKFPHIFPVIHKTIRRAFIDKFPYGIFYVEEVESIIVFAVLHARRSPKEWTQRI